VLLEKIGAIQSPRVTDGQLGRISSRRLGMRPLLGMASLQGLQYFETEAVQIL
jgi:hypothetical protein